jgi:ATP-dependent Clp protease ATP-binding subunit ClpC
MAEKVKEEVNRTFNPEFLNRLDDVIVFHPLDRKHITEIVSILFQHVSARLGEEGLTIRRTEGATNFLVDHGYDEHFGARPLKRAIQRYVEDPLSDKILTGDFTLGDEIEVDVAPEGDKLVFRALSGTKTAT